MNRIARIQIMGRLYIIGVQSHCGGQDALNKIAAVFDIISVQRKAWGPVVDPLAVTKPCVKPPGAEKQPRDPRDCLVTVKVLHGASTGNS